ncbi:MAG: sensor histidine kinase [Actinomycetota bacterium]
MRDSLRSLLAEPSVPNPPVRVWRDWVLLALMGTSTLLEAQLRDDIEAAPAAFALVLVLMAAVFWRRTHPLAVVAVTFGAMTATTVVGAFVGASDVALYSTVLVVLLPYALFRWASGRDAAIGLAIIVVSAEINGVAIAVAESSSAVLLETWIGSAVFLLLPAAVGALVRYELRVRASELERAKLSEREQLARELHDTVAHHVSAIVIQAQAGHAVAGSDPEAAVDALEVIEEEASRTLAEMRLMVSALREDQAAELSPQRGVADIERLAHNAGTAPAITVELSGDLDDLGSPVDAAVYRLAQESITNAVRHAHNATRIEVSVTGDDTDVRLSVRDDGDTDSTGRTLTGYGLVGMSERAMLLGGTLEAGPNPDRGWSVNAVLPKTGTPT